MKKIYQIFLCSTLVLFLATSCIEEVDPQNNYATPEQVENSPGGFNSFVKAITSSLVGQFTYSDKSQTPYDFGYPTFYLMRDVQGQDIALSYSGSWYQAWYTSSPSLGPQYAISQVPWTYYYRWIKNCNTVLTYAGETPVAERETGAGIAYAMRAMFYMDLARMYAQKTYALDKNSETVPIVTEKTTDNELYKNPRATNQVMWDFIISDLDKAEALLKDYTRSDISTPNISVVYGLKARAYLVMEDWVNAEKYAKLAQVGYTMMTSNQYTDRNTGFNTPNSSWMMGVTYKATDPNVKENDGDSSWGSMMCLEMETGGYASNYGSPMLIDRHLYETVPTTDFRKNNFVDFAIDAINTGVQKTTDSLKQVALEAYTDYPLRVFNTGLVSSTYKALGGLSLKFRAAGNAEGRNNPNVGFCVSVPLMRVEEMYLIEAEAAGMQNEGNGIALLTAFALNRDPSFVYGTHTDSYGNNTNSIFQNQVWWQRRIEFWGEGFATFDIKRFNKGIIRSYANTNHLITNRWNVTGHPQWMDWCIVQTETNYNTSCTNNPVPTKPTSDSTPYVW